MSNAHQNINMPKDNLGIASVHAKLKVVVNSLRHCITKLMLETFKIKCTSDTEVHFLMKTKENLQIFSNYNSIHT